MSGVANAMTLERFYEYNPPIDPDKSYWWAVGTIQVGDYVRSNKDRYNTHTWRVVAIGANSWKNISVLMEMPSNYTKTSGIYDKYWSYGLNENNEPVCRRTMYLNNIKKINPEKGEDMCRCRSSYCFCDSALTYEVNEHSLTVDVSKGKTLRLTLEECAELASFLGTAKGKIKEAKLAALKEQQDDLAKQLAEVESM